MGTKIRLTVCLLWFVALHSIKAQERESIKFANPASPPDDLFKIPEITRDVRYDPMISEWVAKSVLQFAHNLGSVLDENASSNTEIFSPLSVMSALSLLEMGARGNTYSQLVTQLFQFMGGNVESGSWKIHEEFGWMLEDLLSNAKNLKRPRNEALWRKTPFNPMAYGIGGQNTPDDHTIRLANGIFIQQGFSLRPDYKFAAQSVYKSEVMPLDFKGQRDYAKHYINSWINRETLRKIPAIITDDIDSDTSILIASALYFKGFWEQPFLASGTGQTDFFPDGDQDTGSTVKVVMMGGGGVYPFYDAPEYDCRIIGLPYKGNQTTMYVIQPNHSTRRKLNDLQKLLTADKINEMIVKMQQRTGVVAFPKFHVTNTLNLKTPLEKMGITDIFRNGQSDLSLIAGDAQNFVQTASAAVPQALAPQLPQGSSLARDPPLFRVPLSAASIVRGESPLPSLQAPVSNDPHLLQSSANAGLKDRFNETVLIFTGSNGADEPVQPTPLPQRSQRQWSQQGDLITGKMQRHRRSVTYKVESEFMHRNAPLRFKDLILSKRITKSNPGKKLTRSRRQAVPESFISLQNLDKLRLESVSEKPQLYVDDILHKVDFEVNEQGTEAAAATLTWLRRSGTDIAFRCDTPFMVLVRHDPTQLPLFYGKVNIPL